MELMSAFLRVADAKEEINPQLKEWVAHLREITHDTEDVLEKYMLRFVHPPSWCNGFGCFIKKKYASFKKFELPSSNVSKNQQRYQDMHAIIDQGSISTLVSTPSHGMTVEEMHSYWKKQMDVVGIEKPKKQLLKWLLSPDNGLKVISFTMVKMVRDDASLKAKFDHHAWITVSESFKAEQPWLGKTIMVKKVYDDASLKAKFDHHVWITLSESFKTEHLLRDMLKQLVDEVKQPPPQGIEVTLS